MSGLQSTVLTQSVVSVAAAPVRLRQASRTAAACCFVGTNGDLSIGHDGTVTPGNGVPLPAGVVAVEKNYQGDIWAVSATGAGVDTRVWAVG
jgi:hypothetical protein